MNILPVYAVKESAADGTKNRFDVQIYRDNGLPFGRFPWHYKRKPTKRNKYVTLNCYKWRIVWVYPTGGEITCNTVYMKRKTKTRSTGYFTAWNPRSDT